MTKPKLCIYHGGCDDGFAAAWAFRKRFPDAEFFAGSYGIAPPDVTAREVVLVDFSYKKPVLQEMLKTCQSLLVLDHHKTAKEDLDFLCPITSFDHFLSSPVRGCALFDMNRSGAGITWDFFNMQYPRPEFIDYIEDRDLWKKQLPNGDEFTIALRSFPQEFAVWDMLVQDGVQKLIEEGVAIQRYYRARVEEFKAHRYRATIAGHLCNIVNVPYFAASEVAGEIAAMDDVDFGACYFEVASGKYQYSLRSRGDFDVSEVAKKFGGGHKNAAGISNSTIVHIKFPAE